MGEKRKLQADIDRCLKAVTERVEIFDETWTKVQEASSLTLKDKFEGDLKKEIKKLQRHRDQIKSWLQNNEVKDKQVLLDKRKLIEQKMEQFKVIERETKTKAFSKTGLTAAEKLDPREKEKEDLIQWLNDSLDKLNMANEKCESEIESSQQTTGKRKHKLDKEKQDRVDESKKVIERNKFHIQRLELILRLFNNSQLENEAITNFRDDLDYYLENAGDPDVDKNEYMYDELSLDIIELNQQLGNVNIIGSLDEHDQNSETATTASTSPSPSPGPGHRESISSSRDSEEKQRNVSEPDKNNKTVAHRQNSLTRSTPNTPLRNNFQHSTSQDRDQSQPTPPPTNNITPPPQTGMAYNSVAAGGSSRNITTPQSGMSGGSSGGTAAQSPFKPLEINSSLTAASKMHLEALSPSVAVGGFSGRSQSPSSTVGLSESSSQGPTPLFPELAAATTQSQSADLYFAALASQAAKATSVVVSSSDNTTTNTSLNSSGSLPGVASRQYEVTSSVSAAGSMSSSLMQSLVSGGSIGSASTGLSSLMNGPGGGVSSMSAADENQIDKPPPFQGLTKTELREVQLSILSDSTNFDDDVTVNSRSSVPPLSSNPFVSAAFSSMESPSLKQTAVMAVGSVVGAVGAHVSQQPPQQTNSFLYESHISGSKTPSKTPVAAATPTPLSGSSLSAAAGSLTVASAQQQPQPHSLVSAFNALSGSSSGTQQQQQQQPSDMGPQEAFIPPALGANPLGKQPWAVEQRPQQVMVEASAHHLPLPADSERLRTYLPRSPVNIPKWYPAMPPAGVDSVEFFNRLTPETLFFIFYYMQGTKAQYLAAKALKKQSWRFHTKYMMWFQRNEQPEMINDEYEQGTYIYFDFEKWAQRKKEGFTFEYKYLEDRSLE